MNYIERAKLDGMLRILHSIDELERLGEESVVERPYRMTATLTVAQKEALQELASKYKVSVAWLIRQAVDRFIEEATGGPKLPFQTR